MGNDFKEHSTNKRGKKILVVLYGNIRTDGRVQRSLEALIDSAEVKLIDLNGIWSFPAFSTFVENIESKFSSEKLSLVKFWLIASMVILKEKPDVVVVHDYYLPILGWPLKIFGVKRRIYDMHEVLNVDNSSAYEYFRSRFFRLLETVCIQSFDGIIVTTVQRGRVTKRRYGLRRQPSVIRNIPFAPKDVVTASAMPKDGDSVELVYAGVLNARRGLETALRALQLLPDHYRLNFLGFGPSESDLKSAVEKMGLGTRVRFHGHVGARNLVSELKRFHIGIALYSYDTINDRLCAPNKFFEYAFAGLPIVASDNLGLKRLARLHGNAVLFSNRNENRKRVKDLAKAIQQARDNWCELSKSSCRIVATENYRSEAEIYKTVVNYEL